MHFVDDFAQRAKNYLAEANDNPVFPAVESIQNLARFSTQLPFQSQQPSEVLAVLDDFGSAATVKTTGGRYFGFVMGGSLPAALCAKLMAAVWDQNAGLTVMSPVAAKLEEIAGAWMTDLFGLPKDSGFGFVSGDTMANFTALAAARHALLQQVGWNVEAEGLFGAPAITVVVGEHVHVSVLKALSMLGFGRDRVVRLPADEQGRMIAGSLENIREPAIICVQAGEVNAGSFDPIEEICLQVKDKNVWVHVDGAFGLWAAAAPQTRHLVQGVALAHSWAVDAHKWLNVPYDAGVVFVKDKAALFAAMSASAAYLPHDALREPFQYVPEMSRAARGIPVWAALQSLGRQGLANMIAQHCRQAKMFAAALSAAGYAILNDVVLNQVMVSFGDNAITQQVIRDVQHEGTCWCGGTTWKGIAAMRISVCCHATTDEDVELSVQAIIRVARQVTHAKAGVQV